MEVSILANGVVVIILQHISVQLNMLYTLNFHSVICQLYITEGGKKQEGGNLDGDTQGKFHVTGGGRD